MLTFNVLIVLAIWCQYCTIYFYTSAKVIPSSKFSSESFTTEVDNGGFVRADSFTKALQNHDRSVKDLKIVEYNGNYRTSGFGDFHLHDNVIKYALLRQLFFLNYDGWVGQIFSMSTLTSTVYNFK